MYEKLIEKKLINAVKMKGGKAIKFFSPFETGFPDRLILMPGGQAAWVELKTFGEDLRANQKVRKMELEKLGFKVHVIDSSLTLEKFINEI